MGYLGNRPAEAYSAFQKQDFSTSATTSYTLDHPVANQNEIALFINFVRQEPTTAYTASGTSLTLTSATSSSDDMYCVYLGKAVQTVNPPSGSVGASQLASDAVTAAKLNDDIISGQTALASEPADTDEFLVSDAGTLKRIDYSLIKGGGITEADMYRLTANSNDSDVTPLTAWERVDDATFSKIGTGISVSSGIFSFPSTGLYLVKVKAMTRVNTGAYDNLRLRGSNDNFSSNNDVLALQSYGVVSAGNPYQSNVLETFFNCTNVSTHKVKFDFHAQSSMDIYGDTNDNVTTIAFIRLGDSQ
jgi:hypothetical protein